MNPTLRGIRRGAAVAIALLLAGCSNDHQELRGWMEQVRADTRPIRQKIDEPKRFVAFRYERPAEGNPFAQTRLSGLDFDIEAPAATRTGLRPDTQRSREFLEAFPLDTIRLVGHLANDRQKFALLQAEGTVHQARVGNHLGQNFGLITSISEGEVQLRELVQDAAGDWVHRDTTLLLQEEAK